MLGIFANMSVNVQGNDREVAAAEGATALQGLSDAAVTMAPRLDTASRATVSADLQTMISQLFGFTVPSDRPLMEAGLDSLAAVEFRNAVAAKFSMDIPATAIFDHPTIDALSAFIAQRIAPEEQTHRPPLVAAQSRSSAEVEAQIQQIVTGNATPAKYTCTDTYFHMTFLIPEV